MSFAHVTPDLHQIFRQRCLTSPDRLPSEWGTVPNSGRQMEVVAVKKQQQCVILV